MKPRRDAVTKWLPLALIVAGGCGYVLLSFLIRPEERHPTLKVVNFDSKMVEEMGRYQRFAWKFSVENPSDEPIRFGASFIWKDADGFILDSAPVYGKFAQPGVSEFSGNWPIKATTAERIRVIGVQLK